MKRIRLKKTLAILNVLGLLIVFAFVFFNKYDANSGKSQNSSANIKKLDKLFRQMSVIKVPHETKLVEINLKDMYGNQVSISDFRGKIVFLNFWATWCPACRAEMPSMERLHKKFKDKDFVMVAINLQESVSTVKKFFKDFKLTFLALLDRDGEVGTRFRVRNLPTTYILDKEGKILGMAVGTREWDSKDSITLFEYLVDLESWQLRSLGIPA